MNKKNIIILLIALLVVVAGAWCIVGGSLSYQECRDPKSQSRQDQKAYGPNQGVSVFPIVNSRGDCIGYFVSANSEAMTALSTLMLAFVTIGLVLLGLEQSNTTRAQLRAYIFVEEIGMWDGPTTPNAAAPVLVGCPNCRITIKNSGTTPAFHVRHWAKVIAAPVNLDGTFAPGTLAINDKEARKMPETAIGPGGRTHLGRNLERALTPYEVQVLSSPQPTFGVFMYGRIIYDDSFGNEHVTDYCLGHGGGYPPPPGVILTFMADGNRAT